MISCGFKRIAQVFENTPVVVMDHGCFPVHHLLGAHYFSTKGLADTLVSQTDTKNGDSASKGFYQGFSATDARSLYLAYHEGYGGFKRKTYRKKQWLIKVADRVQARSEMYQQQYWGCAKELKRKRFFFF